MATRQSVLKRIRWIASALCGLRLLAIVDSRELGFGGISYREDETMCFGYLKRYIVQGTLVSVVYNVDGRGG